MAPAEDDMSTAELTLIVAATLKNGIGKAGSLPWRLKKEMAYFKRVTTRIPTQQGSTDRAQNVVVMGRKTWESIPSKFRPLPDRTNLVVTRSALHVKPEVDHAVAHTVTDPSDGIAGALEHLERRREAGTVPPVGHIFVIGGASIYEQALALRQTTRVLMTRIRNDFDCDTYFPLDLDGADGEREGWRRMSLAALNAFTGEEFEDGRMVEGDVEYEFCLYERSRC
ncbi:hypothetical protein LTR66_006815 [Elasticomyces elasticus]|nr:hypothetical protein LTR50_006867 [Elasticomyces elasticus]KAK4990420.1 hypothetical protein LTR66_006815 [Elasticomyces elasticus]